jgi:hypothetical protein
MSEYTTKDLKKQLRIGQFAWPGGYQLCFITDDGCALSFEAVRDNLRSVFHSMHNKINDGWRITGCEVNWEDENLLCSHTGKQIPCAYGG